MSLFRWPLGLSATLLSVSLWAEEPGFESIFTGDNFDGWVLPEGNLWWTASDGICRGQSDPKMKGSILWTESSYRDFILELDFRMGGEADSGIFLRHKREQIQIGLSGSKKRDVTASSYISGKGCPVEAEGVASLLKAEDWNRMRIRPEGPVYTV